MWIARIRFSTEKTLIGAEAVKYQVSVFGFPLSYSKQGRWMIVQLAGTIIGADENKRRFIAALRKKKRVMNLELNNDFLIAIIKEPHFIDKLYTKDIIHVEPALISEKGYELLSVGSFDREKVVAVSQIFIERYQGKLLSIQKKSIHSLSIMKIRPELTEKQKIAVELAVKNGYYQSPRKIDLVRLARMAGLSYATYQVHLRKAEAKLLPNMIE
ncbi:MAG: helix-turn-helix domain-containing protein [Nanoarchaeota archaeon]